MEMALPYLLKSAGILTLFYFSYQLLLKKETFFRTNRHFLLAGILASYLLPFVVFTKYVVVEPEPFDPSWLLANTSLTNNAVIEPEPFDWMSVLYWGYVIIMLILASKFIIQLLSLYRLIKTNGIKKVNGYKLVETKGNISPFSFFNYIVYNPNTYNRVDLNIILKHEKAHGKQLHSIDIIIAQVLIITQWFNPFAWLYKKSIQQNLEFMADQTAIAKVNCSKHYQHTLLKASLKPQYASITNNFYNSLIKKRIVMLNQSKSSIKNSWKYLVVLPSLALFLMSFNVKTVEVIKEKPTPATNLDTAFYPDDRQPKQHNSSEPEEDPTLTKNSQSPTTEKGTLQEVIKIKIHKNSSDADLEAAVNTLKKHGIDMHFNNIMRNADNEITGLQASFEDSNGNSGNYSLIGDEPIKTFYFVKDENSIGFASEPQSPMERIKKEKEQNARELARSKRLEMREKQDAMRHERQEDVETRKQAMEKRKADIEEHRKEIEVRIREARDHQKEAMEKQRKKYEVIIKERKEIHDSLKNKQQAFITATDFNDKNVLFILDGDEVNMGDIKFLSPDKIAKVNVLKGDSALKFYGKKGKDGVIEITTKSSKDPYKISYKVGSIVFDADDDNTTPNADAKLFFKGSGFSMIKKTTTNEDLKTMKQNFESKNITLKYSKVKRNDSGEITRIKVSLNDDKGNKSSATFDTGNQGINTILVGKNDKNLIIKSI